MVVKLAQSVSNHSSSEPFSTCLIDSIAWFAYVNPNLEVTHLICF